jgi:anti-sigma B factor antagonist
MHRIDTRADAQVLTVSMAGDIDVAAAGDLREAGLRAIEQADGRPVVLDAGGVTFIDSTGLGALVALNNAAEETNARILLRSVPPRMATLLRVTALDHVFQVDQAAAEQAG